MWKDDGWEIWRWGFWVITVILCKVAMIWVFHAALLASSYSLGIRDTDNRDA